MENQEKLKEYKKQDDKICLSHILDKINMSKKTNKIEVTDFLDMYQISLIQSFLKKNNISNYILQGGYENAERKLFIAFPEKYDEQMIAKNYNKIFKIVRIKLPKEDIGSFTHRNYLGAIIKLGLKREKVGDILVARDGADIIVKEEFAQILANELKALNRFENSNITIDEIENLKEHQITIEEIKIIVPSMRLDNIVSDLSKTSRSKAVQIINQERVFVNGKNETKVSKNVKMDDVITIRGKGRFIIKSIEGTTRSGRNILKIEKYV